MRIKTFIFMGLSCVGVGGCAVFSSGDEKPILRVSSSENSVLTVLSRAPQTWPFLGKREILQRVTVRKATERHSFFLHLTMGPAVMEGVVFSEGMGAPLYRFEWTPRVFKGRGEPLFVEKMNFQVFCVDFLTSMMPMNWLEKTNWGPFIKESQKDGLYHRDVNLGINGGTREVIYAKKTEDKLTAFQVINQEGGYVLDIQTVEGA